MEFRKYGKNIMGYHMTEEELNRIEQREGWYWPFKDRSCWPWLQNEKDNPNLVSEYCQRRRTVIQAGGNVGFYVRPYAELFDRVITFEPERLNFQCLVQNVTEPNVIKVQACLGYQRDAVGMVVSRKNIGAYHVSEKPGLIPTLLIDDFNVQDCDLIHLDIEGFELNALRGAVETIRRCRPVIALEWMNHGEKYGAPDSAIEEFLLELGYVTAGNVYHDRVFRPGEHTAACDSNSVQTEDQQNSNGTVPTV
jgi:FkbM family methyltransferase